MSVKTVSVVVFLFICVSLSGQNIIVSGKVTGSNDSLPLIGANIIVKGTSTGTTADFEGNYSINVNSQLDTLVFSFVGMNPYEVAVGSNKIINVTLSDQAYQVDEVVVTALGITRQSKSLGYSVEKIDADEITKGNDRSFLNSLQGKVAGVNISSSSGAPGSSSRILIRGISSLGRSNQPLFIVDGVPVNNSFSGSESINGGTDFGNKANDINPEDIESISVLKGSAGTSLYGSRASNGVIIITTKKGKFNESASFTYSSNVTFEEPLRLVKYQNEYGQGINGDFVSYENMSWGPAFDGVVRFWGNEVDSSYRVKPYVALPNNVKEFFDIGQTYSNSVSISGGGQLAAYYISYSNVVSDGIFPTDADSYKRNTLSLRTEFKPTNKFSGSISLNYVNKKSKYVLTGQSESSVYNQVMQTPRDISLIELSNISDSYNTLDNYYSLYTVNPYFILNNNSSNYNEDRIYGNINLEYKFLENLKFQVRIGNDFSYERAKSWKTVIEPDGNNKYSAIYDPGEISKSTNYVSILNGDALLTYEKKLGSNFKLQIIAGSNVYESNTNNLYSNVSGLTIDSIYILSNTNESPYVYEYLTKKRLIGMYSNADLSYKDYLFLSLTARNDWSSTLSPGKNSFFYPGVSLGFVFTELIPTVQKILTYGKIRVGFAQTGNDAPLYRLSNTYVRGGVSDGYGAFMFPVSGINGYELDNLLGNPGLRPELRNEYEIGTDLRFLRNRIGVDFTYYNNNITNLIWDADISSTSGFTSKTTNLGKIENKGIELLLTIVPVKTRTLNWELSFNFAKNDNKLVYLNDYTEKVVITGIGVSGGQQINYVAKPGRPIGIFEARTILRDEEGRIVVDNQGVPRSTDDLVEYGDGNYDYTLGVGNVVTIGGISLSASFDIRQGGIMYSRTKDICAWAGTIPVTLYNDRQPFIVPNSVYEAGRDNQGNIIYKENTKPIDQEHLIEFWSNGGYESDGFALIDKSFIKLREVSVSYELSQKLLQKLPFKGLSINIVGKNLYLWTPDDQTYIDPEVSTFGTDLRSNFGEYSATPSTRSISCGLRVTF